MSEPIRAWVTTPPDVRLADIERSRTTPYRALSFSWERGAAGTCGLQFDVTRVDGSIFAKGNLIWMLYRGECRVYVSRGASKRLSRDEHGSDWATVTGIGVKSLLRRRLVYPSAFDPSTADGRTPAKWPKAWSTKLDGDAASGQKVVPVKSTIGAAVGMPVELVSADGTTLGEIASISAGVSVTLKDDLDRAYAAGDRAYDATKQWRRFVNRAAGEMLWDMIAESNPRFALQFTRGSVESTGSDGWTQDFAFETLWDVVDAVEAAFGDVDITGDPATGSLVFNYYADIGSNRSATIIFEEGADLVEVEVDESAGPDDDAPTALVGSGEGEGITRPMLGYADTGAADRVEAFLDLRDVKDPSQIQTQTTAALTELRRVNGTSVACEVTETRYRAITDYGKGDDVRIICPSRGIDVTDQIVALYVIEQDDETRVKFDLGAPRTAADLKARARQKQIARSTGVSVKGQRGQLVPVSIADTVYFDSATASISGIYIPDRIGLVVECRVAIDFDQYPMPVSAAASGGGATTNETGLHRHIWAHRADGAVGGTKRSFYGEASDGFDESFMLESDYNGDLYTFGEQGAHTHSTPAHTHNLTAAATKEAYPALHSVTLKVYRLDDATWTQVGATISGITSDAPDIDLTSYITGPGRWRIVLQSAAGQPNGGRLGAHLAGYLLGSIESA